MDLKSLESNDIMIDINDHIRYIHGIYFDHSEKIMVIPSLIPIPEDAFKNGIPDTRYIRLMDITLIDHENGTSLTSEFILIPIHGHFNVKIIDKKPFLELSSVRFNLFSMFEYDVKFYDHNPILAAERVRNRVRWLEFNEENISKYIVDIPRLSYLSKRSKGRPHVF